MGYNEKLLQEGVMMLAEAPWSTRLVEQAHGSTACVHRLHKEYGLEALSARSYLHQARHMFVPDKDALALERAQAQTEAFRKTLNRCVTGRNVFFREFMAEMQ
eukprot:8471520-Lingulodinium_polyedra.AAC.1